MNGYYNKLIKKTKLLNFWTFSGIELKSIFLFNYKSIIFFYRQNVFVEYSNCVSVIKSIFPILNSIIDNQARVLFVGTQCFYTQSFFQPKSKFVSKLIERKVGGVTNFILEGFKFFNNTTFKKNSSLIIFFNISMNDFLLIESKKKKNSKYWFSKRK